MWLLRKLQSDLAGDAEVAHSKALAPHAEMADVVWAGNMLAGVRDDAFDAAVFAFREKLDSQAV